MEVDPTLAILWQTAVRSLSFTTRCVLIVLAGFVIIALPSYLVFKVVRLIQRAFFVCVPEGYEAVIERGGKFHRIIQPGIHIMWPWLESFRSPSFCSLRPSTGVDASSGEKQQQGESVGGEPTTTTTTKGRSVADTSLSLQEYAKKNYFDKRKQVLQVAPVTLAFQYQNRDVHFQTELHVVYNFNDVYAVCYDCSSIDDMLNYSIITAAASKRWNWTETSQKQDIEQSILASVKEGLQKSGITIVAITISSYIVMPVVVLPSHKKKKKKRVHKSAFSDSDSDEE